MGCIYKRKTKIKDKLTGEVLRVVEGDTWWIKFYQHGRPHQESSRSEKMEDARRLLKLREGEIAEGKVPGITFNKVRFNELAEDLLSDYRVNGRKSLDRAQHSVKHLKDFFEGLRAPEITTPRIRRYIEARLEEGAENGTINRELAALKRMLNIGAQQTPPRVDRVPFIPMLKENNVRKGFFEHGDFLALRNVLPGHLKGFVTFGYKTGWRKAEIETLTWAQVDLDQGIVRLEPGDTKNDDARTVYLDNELVKVFKSQREKRKSQKQILPYVFPNEEGTDRIRDFRGAWKRACIEAMIGKRLFHDFRRTAVRNMVRAGIPERVAMMISGHKTRTVFDRYNIVNADDLKQAASKQEAYLQSQMVTKTVTITDFSKKAASTGSRKPFDYQDGAREGTRTPTELPTGS